ncbi:hypothetical protein A2U01_0048488, partial [Trifolium medium]|nr:hypothetical protein [Trifolium medium]
HQPVFFNSDGQPPCRSFFGGGATAPEP